MNKTLVIIGVMALTLLVYWYFSSENAFTAPPRIPKTQPLAFKMSKLEKRFGDCPTPEERCLLVKLEYPIALEGRDTAREIINNSIRHHIIRMLQAGDEEVNLDSHIDTVLLDLADTYQDLLEEIPDQGMSWTFQSEGKVLFLSDSVLTLQMFDYNYAGGAHPNTFLTIYNFDPRSGRQLSWSDFTSDTLSLKKVAENEFRKAHQLKPKDNLEDAGFWFPNNQFTLPANYGRTADGLYFYYNPYEIAPYVVGPTAFVVKI